MCAHACNSLPPTLGDGDIVVLQAEPPRRLRTRSRLSPAGRTAPSQHGTAGRHSRVQAQWPGRPRRSREGLPWTPQTPRNSFASWSPAGCHCRSCWRKVRSPKQHQADAYIGAAPFRPGAESGVVTGRRPGPRRRRQGLQNIPGARPSRESLLFCIRDPWTAEPRTSGESLRRLAVLPPLENGLTRQETLHQALKPTRYQPGSQRLVPPAGLSPGLPTRRGRTGSPRGIPGPFRRRLRARRPRREAPVRIQGGARLPQRSDP